MLQPEDIAWKQIEPQELKPGNMVRGQVAESEFLGASTRRDLANGEPLAASDLLKLSDRRFLAAVLKPGARAISISVDAAQSASGLILPGNHVDVILTQNLGEVTGEGKRKVVAETILQDVRVIAVDQAINPQAKAQRRRAAVFRRDADAEDGDPGIDQAAGGDGVCCAAARVPSACGSSS